MSRPRAVIAEDHVLLQESIREILQRECEVVDTVEDGRAALAAVETHKPDLLLVDLSLPFVNGFGVAEALRNAQFAPKVLMVTAHAEAAYVKRAFELGVAAYLLKGSLRMELLAAVREVLAGGRYTSAALRTAQR